ncbi:hypothetical protein CTI12_AA167730 [Artemisia annua]|uniref:Hexosyltransferase n=1 Tax=Artemisia annua TaxID=35608 RepID=A0A2U1NJW5_ARTAN|nr:hypothetical protein CTI12_AA167730 [Artemisia annua]
MCVTKHDMANAVSNLTDSLEQITTAITESEVLIVAESIKVYLPEVYPKLDKKLFLDDDIVVKKDLRPLWNVDLQGMVNGAVEMVRSYYMICRFDNDIGSGGPLRILTLRDKREVGYTTLQEPDHASQKLPLMNESEPKVVKGAEENRYTSMHATGSVSGYANVPKKSTKTATKILQHLENPSPMEKSSGSTKSPTKLTLDMIGR